MNADALVSVHINSAGSSASGAEVEIPNTSLYPELHTEGENIANSILNELSSLGIHRRGAFTRNSANGTTYSDGSTADYYAIVRGAKSNAMTGIIVEHAFISNPNELGQFLSSEDKLKALGRADARGINNYYATHTPVREVRESDYALVYDYNYYINKYSDLKNAFGTNRNAAFNHFLSYGMNEGRQGNDKFNVSCYKQNYADLQKAFGNNLKSYYEHYISNGHKEGRVADKLINNTNTGDRNTAPTVNKTVYQGVDYAPVYDADYYYKNNADVQKQFKSTDYAGLLKNFVEKGMAQGQRASANFDVNSYRLQYPDLRAAFGDDLKAYYMHYITDGKREKRKTTGTSQMVGSVTKINGVDYSSVYDYNYYINKYSDLKQAFGYNDTAALQHFVTYGMKESRQANSSFILSYYRANYADLRNAFGNNNTAYYLHYITYGKKEGRIANRLLPPTNTNNSNNNSNTNTDTNTTTRPTSPTNSQSNQNTNAPMYEIAGSPKATEAQMVKYFLSKVEFPDFYSTHDSEVKTINDFVHIYYQEATAEGIRPEVAFAQMCNETGFLRYTGRVKIEQYNFAGLGAIDRDQSSNSFSSVREGIRAQIQHLKAYAVKNPTLKYPLVDGRFKYVTKGSAQYVEWLGTNENPNHYGWATTPGYGNALRKIIDDILATK